ncbi:glycosyltransferase family 2 protein [Salisaeta longa]|uniref:glycosyltransferase family 2 protein n=1 Tax=Salisaeta longa TaxID=503170 RepID=UPI0003B783B1|nr:glycosyltransferase family 2 protein [Salisaeta longa]
MPAPRVSIIIVTWNGLDLLQQCLPSVVATTYPNVEIILADNASADGSIPWVRTAFPDVRIVQHPDNWLFARGNNAAVQRATGRYLLFLNNDVEVPPGWLDPLVEAMEAQPTLGAVQPKLLQYDRRDRFEYAGAAGGFIDRLGYPFTRGRVFDTMEPDRGQYDTPRDVFWATGAACMVRRAAFDAVGRFDERFEMHMEEIDLCWRLWRAGYRVRALPSSTVYHIGGASLPQGTPRKIYYNFRNSLLMLYKNLPPARWARVFPQRVALDGIAAARMLLQGEAAGARAVVRAYRDAHRLRSYYTPPRRSAVRMPYRRLIAADYFLRGLRTFDALPRRHFTSIRAAA